MTRPPDPSSHPGETPNTQFIPYGLLCACIFEAPKYVGCRDGCAMPVRAESSTSRIQVSFFKLYQTGWFVGQSRLVLNMFLSFQLLIHWLSVIEEDCGSLQVHGHSCPLEGHKHGDRNDHKQFSIRWPIVAVTKQSRSNGNCGKAVLLGSEYYWLDQRTAPELCWKISSSVSISGGRQQRKLGGSSYACPCYVVNNTFSDLRSLGNSEIIRAWKDY